MTPFLQKWGEAAYTSVGLFWMALWAFVLGYIVSSLIQVFVTTASMRKVMGKDDLKGMAAATFFGFVSSSCSFSALSTTRALFRKGAAFAASIAFLLSSTNLVIELGIVISVFIGWQFVVGEYVGGILLISICWVLIRIIRPEGLIKEARAHLKSSEKKSMNMQKNVASLETWSRVGRKYVMEWQMVWKDVLVGFTLAGVIAVFVPDTFFQTLFIHSGPGQESQSFLVLLEHTLAGPAAAFCTFIGSMGNIPLAALLYDNGVSFAGVMAFIFSDLVVFPVLRIQAGYYGWKMALFILGLLLTALIVTSITLHYGLDAFGALPHGGGKSLTDREYFTFDYTFYLDCAFLLLSGVLIYLSQMRSEKKMHHGGMASKGRLLDKILRILACVAIAWLTAGLILYFVAG